MNLKQVKLLAQRAWHEGDHQGSKSDYTYFEYGFIAALNLHKYDSKSQQKRLEALQKLSDLDQKLGLE